MELTDLTFIGPRIDDAGVLSGVTAKLSSLLHQVNGFIEFGGGLHVRGACLEPEWHSLRAAWHGQHAFAKLYGSVRAEDIPFGQDCVGDQFLLREGVVWRLEAETGDMESFACGLNEFLSRAQRDPVGYLSLAPLQNFHESVGELLPGRLIHAVPPFCVKGDGPPSLRDVEAGELILWHAEFAAQIADLPDGAQISLKIDV